FHMFNADRDVKFWRCEHQHGDVKCRGRVHTTLNDVVLKTVGEHNCQHSASNVAKQQIVTGIKRRAAETMETPAAIRAHALQQIPTPLLVKRVRHEIGAPPPVPTSIEQLVIPEDYRIYKRSATAQEPFLIIRNMKKRVAEQGLTHLYNTDAAFSQSARMITSLAFLPVADLNPALDALKDFLPENLNGVLDWFVINYIGRLRQNNTRARPLFQPEQWSVHQRTLDGIDRTNNYAESYHRTLQHAFENGRRQHGALYRRQCSSAKSKEVPRR
uniref:FLYWCH-type domain-containing protein n=1 Tax=Globodera pallida TaxID=36090 RepID=A0A183CMB9_GLOPA